MSAPPTPESRGPLVALKSGPEHARLVCHLQWLPATDARNTISELLRQEADFSSPEGKGGSAMRVAIVNDPVTNSLVISGPPAAVEEVRKLAEALDQPQPRVQFDMELGEVEAGEVKHGGGLTSEGLAAAAEKTSTFYILERPKTMKTLARASALTLDNQPANIRMGQTVPTISSVSRIGRGGGGMGMGGAAGEGAVTLTPLFIYQSEGTLLTLTPRTNVGEGTIVLNVDVQDSRLGPGNQDFLLPLAVVDKKEIYPMETHTLTLQTTVAIPDGKTIMLGSIGRQGKDEKELVIVITPHIIRPEGASKTGAAVPRPEAQPPAK